MVMPFNLEAEFQWCLEALHKQIASKVAAGDLTYQEGQELHTEVEYRLQSTDSTTEWQSSLC